MDLGLGGRVALVTGGSRGIGAAIAAGLAAEGCRVAICARGEEVLRETVARIGAGGADVLPLVADLTAAGEVERIVGREGIFVGLIVDLFLDHRLRLRRRRRDGLRRRLELLVGDGPPVLLRRRRGFVATEGRLDALRGVGKSIPFEQIRDRIGKGGDKLLLEVA